MSPCAKPTGPSHSRGAALLPEPRNRVLEKMLERLYAALASGPSLNCRPHNSRQRVDLASLSRLDSTRPQAVLAALLGEKASIRLSIKPPALHAGAEPSLPPSASSEQRESSDDAAEPDSVHTRAEEEQQALLRKLATIVEDARTFEQDTGAHVLHVGFPLLHLPPRAKEKRGFGARRILAPIAFIPVRLTLKKGRAPSVELEGSEEGADRVAPNTALLAWLEQQTGHRFGEFFADEEGAQPWRELNELVAAVAKALELPTPEPFTEATPLAPVPRSDNTSAEQAAILPCAVLGLYPLSNQSLVDDTKALLDGEPVSGPLESFLRVDVSLGEAASSGTNEPNLEGVKRAAEERLVTLSDPCQARAVRLARSSRGLVIHGPPGTGKSQTIANAIGDHLARGERVLLVCDKRTALDVVKHRLDRLGLGSLCAVVHDAQRDQRNLYMGIREQLDALPEQKTSPAVLHELSRVDAELQSLHDELSTADTALSHRPLNGTAPSFHELVGQWLAVTSPESLATATAGLSATRLSAVTPREREVREVLERGAKEGYTGNPWRDALGVELNTYLATPLATYRDRLAALREAAREADALSSPAMPAFGADPRAEGQARAALAEKLAPLLETISPESLARWSSASPEAVQTAKEQLDGLTPQLQVLAEGPLDAELALVHRQEPWILSVVYQALATLGAYLAIARKWYSFIFFGRRSGARRVLQRFGLGLEPLAAERVTRFLGGVRARGLLTEYHRASLAASTAEAVSDEALSRSLRSHAALFEVLSELNRSPLLASCREAVRQALRGGAEDSRALLVLLRQSSARGEAISRLEARLAEVSLFSPAWRQARSQELRTGAALGSMAAAIQSHLSTVEGLLRMRALLAQMPQELSTSVEQLARLGTSAEDGWRAVLKATLAAEISARLREDPALQRIDAEGVRAAQARYQALEARKRQLVRDVILHRWTQRQRERLLASTGGRLNSQGAELRRRLMLRGERAMRVRQVIAVGQELEGGDPLFDVRPVWMASPQTVAQLFPRRPIFDVVIFDESSQCRLEEALPVLTRAKRVVIAGDPKQLPPTRFFESAVVQSQEAEAETEQGLFEEQQSEVEDLLSAALNLDIEQSYLDVHYRSQNADLIEFSNTHFYDKRLQPIPAHPSHRAPHAPLRLLPVAGTYEKRVNLAEARAVGAVVRELLARPEPPSIGIACFNLVQRDAITDVLDEMAAEDTDFAARLAAARSRQGAGSFEGLFVKNLENVQGDERDHIIISTTYGPDKQGRFYRRFGPLGSAGGGRRLNVLVTRARQQVHLLTSIPREIYTTLPPLEEGRQPNGGWLLFAYLQYAERLAHDYQKDAEALSKPVAHVPSVTTRQTEASSAFAQALAERLASQHGLSSEVHWGNDGFCVDLALHHPANPGGGTIGVLCDGTRYPKATDRVEWDLFRTWVLESQGWKLVRLWTPHFFRDPEGATAGLLKAASSELAREPSSSMAFAHKRRTLH